MVVEGGKNPKGANPVGGLSRTSEPAFEGDDSRVDTIELRQDEYRSVSNAVDMRDVSDWRNFGDIVAWSAGTVP